MKILRTVTHAALESVTASLLEEVKRRLIKAGIRGHDMEADYRENVIRVRTHGKDSPMAEQNYNLIARQQGLTWKGFDNQRNACFSM